MATRASGEQRQGAASGWRQADGAGGPFADAFIVSRADRIKGRGRASTSSPPMPKGVERRDYRMADGSTASDVDASAMPRPSRLPGDLRVARSARFDDARLAISAELLGLMNMMFDATLDYVKTRQQFGQADRPVPVRSSTAWPTIIAPAGTEPVASLPRRGDSRRHDPAHAPAVAGAKAFISRPRHRTG